MKRFLLCVFVVCVGFMNPLMGNSSESSDPGIPIYGSGGTYGGDDPNEKNSSPIMCSYYEDLSSLHFTFLSDLGDVTITVTNFSTGEIMTNVVNSQLGIVNFSISSDHGFYYISIVTSSGSVYYGQFTL